LLGDEKGLVRAMLGTTELEAARTGSTERRAEASLVLFDREGTVLWSLP
jgi:hypothetical protein